MLTTLRTLLRLWFILRIVVRYDALPLLSEKALPYRILVWLAGLRPSTRALRRRYTSSERMRKALEALGPTFIKFGQALSTRVESLPEEVAREMKKLQDEVPPFPFEKVRETIEESLKGRLEDFFPQFDSVPVASASIAQVHHAFTKEGREVAVKVKRPQIDAVVESDIRMLSQLAGLVEMYVPEWRRFRVQKVVDEFAATIRSEMNFQVEAARAQQFRDNFRLDKELRIPEVIWSLSGQRVMTLEWIDGFPIDELRDHPEFASRVDRISRNIVTAFFKQVFRDGYFHADQHPGNIFVTPDGTIVILDFGITGQVSMQTRIWLAVMLQGFLMRDYRKVARVHLDAGYIPMDTDMGEFEEACRQIGEPVFGQPLKEISIGKLLAQLFKVTEQFNMPVQPQLLLLQKTMVTLEGVGREINPELNVWLLAEPLIREWMMDHLGPKGRLLNARETISNSLHATTQLPELLYTGIERLARDRVRMRLHPESLQTLEERMNVGFRQQVAAIFGGALLMSAAMLIASGSSAWWYVPALGLSAGQFLKASRLLK
ncbi:MAG: 2-polyprenylphenol 6-hydroxylase [Magnetococcales bacterium]|nr:2-polyprenylphenol 6-hydroxylase [Magnetococcales bacterium]